MNHPLRSILCAALLLGLSLNLLAAPKAGPLANPGDDDLLADAKKDAAKDQDALLRVSHLSEIFRWPGVQTKKDPGPWERASLAVQPGRIFVKPKDGVPARTVVDVPKAGDYRIWLAYATGTGETHPVTLEITGKTAAKHLFAGVALPNKRGPAVEADLPVRFDSDRERGTYPAGKVVLWEYWDTRLDAGRTVLSLSSSDSAALLDALFITQCKSFTPGGSRVIGQAGLFNKIYYRFRVTTDDKSVRDVALSGGASYIVGLTPRGPYHAQLDAITSAKAQPRIPVGEWSSWIDATEATSTPGVYVNVTMALKAPQNRPLAKGALDIECAWAPMPGAVTDTLTAPVAQGSAAFLAPSAWERFPAPDCPEPRDDLTPAPFAVRSFNSEQKLRTHRQELEAEIARIPPDALKPGVMPQRLQIMTLARLQPGEYDLAIPLLRRTGFNFIYTLDPSVWKKYGLIDGDMRPKSLEMYALINKLEARYGSLLDAYKPGETRDPDVAALAAEIDRASPGYRNAGHWEGMGDEIGPAVDDASVDWIPAQRRRFQDYLRSVSANDPAFFGAASFDDLDFVPQPSPAMPRAQRRLFYHSAVFRWLATAEYYARISDVYRQIFPNILTMCNYSPYTVFYYGPGMDHGQNSFALPRANACTGHWGEDWLSKSGVASLAGVQTESFFAAILRCGSSLHNQPTGIYLVWKLGELDRKMGLLVSQGLKAIHVYYWGPRYLGGGSPESSSHRVPTYAEINRAARAFGPADEIIINGVREPSRVAILYNRTSEMWGDGAEWRRTDRIYTFLALRQAHLPVDFVLEDDLTDERLQPYKVLYLNGANVRRSAIAAVARWVERGGLLCVTSATALRDEYDDPLPEATALFGVAQTPAGNSQGSFEVFQQVLTVHKPIDTVTFDETPLLPALKLPVVGVKTILTPADARPVARYADGSCAAAWRALGKGSVLTLGVMPGYLFAHNAPRDADEHAVNYTPDRRALIAKAPLSAAPPSTVYSDPLAEVARFDHDSGIAVIVTDISYKPGRPATLTVRTDRPIKEAVASLAGPLKWRRAGPNIEIDLPVPDPLDVVILR